MYYQNNVQEITNVEDHDNFIQNNNECIMFFGSNKCKNCDNMTQTFDNIAGSYPHIKFSHVEVTKTEVENLGNSLPLIVCYKNNVPVSKIVTTNKNGIINMIDNNFGRSTQNSEILNNTVRMMSSQNGRKNNFGRSPMIFRDPVKNSEIFNNNLGLTEIEDINNYNKFITTNKKCIVFFGSESCPHCRNIKPLIEKMVVDYSDVKFCHVEVTRKTVDIIPSKYKDVGFPLFICYKNSILVDNVIGEDAPAVIEMIENRLL